MSVAVPAVRRPWSWRTFLGLPPRPLMSVIVAAGWGVAVFAIVVGLVTMAVMGLFPGSWTRQRYSGVHVPEVLLYAQLSTVLLHAPFAALWHGRARFAAARRRWTPTTVVLILVLLWWAAGVGIIVNLPYPLHGLMRGG